MKTKINYINNIFTIILFIVLFIILFIILFIVFILSRYNTNLKISDLNNKYKYNPEKRTCILLSGQIRDNYLEYFNNQKIFLIDPLKADIFCVFDDNMNNEEKIYITKLINPKKIIWTNKKKSDYNVLPTNFYLQLHKLYLCNNLKSIYENNNNFKYDICIRVRPDLFLKSYIPDYIINNIYKNTFYTPFLNILDFYSNVFLLGVTDMFFISNSQVMDSISNIYLYINNKNYKETCIATEIILKQYIVLKNINIKKFYNFYFVLDKISINKYPLLEIINYLYNKPSIFTKKCYESLYLY
jgi:hypothetical protein